MDLIGSFQILYYFSGGGNNYIEEFYFVYSPYVKAGLNSVIIFLKEPGNKLRIEFTVPNSGETFTINHSHFKQTSNAKEICQTDWYKLQEKFISMKFCNSKILPDGKSLL